MTIENEPVGYVRGGRAVPEDDEWGNVQARIELDRVRFTNAALQGLDNFSHAEVTFVFDRVREDQITYDARHPRGRGDWPRVGIFAQRGKKRPNRIGVSICKILAVDDTSLVVQGLDAIDGTPVLDIKPVMSGFRPRGPIEEPAWAKEIMSNYW